MEQVALFRKFFWFFNCYLCFFCSAFHVIIILNSVLYETVAFRIYLKGVPANFKATHSGLVFNVKLAAKVCFDQLNFLTDHISAPDWPED